MIDYYYNSINEDTLTVIAALVKVNKCSHISMQIMHIAKQYGDIEYGLHAIATIVCLAFGDDPCNHSSVSPINMPRCHLGECYTKHFQ